jgi:hypothetical protein
VRAIQEFQTDHQLEVNGIADLNTVTAIQRVMESLNSQLNKVVNMGFPLDIWGKRLNWCMCC